MPSIHDIHVLDSNLSSSPSSPSLLLHSEHQGHQGQSLDAQRCPCGPAPAGL